MYMNISKTILPKSLETKLLLHVEELSFLMLGEPELSAI